MATAEFQLIQRHFAALTAPHADLLLGIGDDAALLRGDVDQAWVWSMDTLVEGVHFAAGADPAALGHKALAVNLSDLAAMGATPVAALLSLTLPEADAAWCAAFAEGFGALAEGHHIALAGGDTTRGPLSISVTVLGRVPAAEALCRDAARVGDLVAVTGPLGDAALALRLGPEAPTALATALHRPVPHLEAGSLLRGLAHAAIDVSDGLMADLQHVCTASGVGAMIRADCLPRSAAFSALSPRDGLQLQAGGGDDYVLCVTVPPDHFQTAQRRLQSAGLALHVIGRIVAGAEARLCTAEGHAVVLDRGGFDHFSEATADV